MSQEITLNEQQQQAKDNLLAFMLDDSKQEIVLQGHAGTGKTTLLKSVIIAYMDLPLDLVDVSKKSVEFLATTHKACEQLTQSLGFPVQTVHSRFSIFPNQSRRLRTFAANKIFIIDEASYIDNQVMSILKNTVLPNNNKIIYVGDKNQLTPVGLNYAPVFYKGLDEIVLTKTVRQQNVQDIAEYCEQLRQSIDTMSPIPPIPNSKNIIHLDEAEFIAKCQELGETVKILSLNNNKVKQYNTMMLKHLYKRTHLDEEDCAVNNEYLRNGLRNNQIVRILGALPAVLHNFKGFYYSLDTGYTVFVPKNITAISKIKKHYPQLINDYRIADLRPTFASTVHKAQGSTFSTVCIDLDTFKTKTSEDLKRLLYVAFSRATDKIYLKGSI